MLQTKRLSKHYWSIQIQISSLVQLCSSELSAPTCSQNTRWSPGWHSNLVWTPHTLSCNRYLRQNHSDHGQLTGKPLFPARPGGPIGPREPYKDCIQKVCEAMYKNHTQLFLINKLFFKKPHLQFHLFDLHLLEGQQDPEFLDLLENLVSLQGQVHHDHPAKQNFNCLLKED